MCQRIHFTANSGDIYHRTPEAEWECTIFPFVLITGNIKGPVVPNTSFKEACTCLTGQNEIHAPVRKKTKKETITINSQYTYN